MISIRWRLTLLLCFAVGMLVISAGLGVLLAMQGLLGEQFSQTLAAKARALITASEIDDGEFEIDLTIQDFAGFGLNGDDYFEIRRLDGTRFLRSPSLSDHADQIGDFQKVVKPRDDAPRIEDGKFADGSAARFYIQRFYPKDDRGSRFQDLYLVVASPTRPMRLQLGLLASVLVIAGAATLAVMVPVVRLGLGRGLKPLDRLTRELVEIRAHQLDQRIDLAAYPAELHQVAASLNHWMGLIESSLERERRFSSHAAHELRTPLAEIRGIAELAVTWPDEASPERCAEIVAVTIEMERLLDQLTMLARMEEGSQHVAIEEIRVRKSIETAIARVASTATARGIDYSITCAPSILTTDRILWQTALNNLIHNAASHASPASTVQISASSAGVEIRNRVADLTPADLPHMAERFWRKDSSRTGAEHSGLGLSIVTHCARLLGITCGFQLDGDELVVSLQFPEAEIASETQESG